MDAITNLTVILTATKTTTTTTPTDAADLMPGWAYNMTAIVLFLIGLFGFTLNLLVIVLMCKELQLWTPMNIILFNLVCSDFSVSIFGNPFTLTAAVAHRWIFGQCLCVAYGFFMSLLGITSITTLTVLSYERYCLVTYPLTSGQLSNRGALGLVVFIWMYSFCLTSPPLFGWGAYINEAANISCSVNWESKTTNATSYIVFLFVFGLLIPVVVISYSYANIIVTMRKNATRLGRTNRAEKRVTYMIAIMVLAFLAAWSPYAAFALIEQFGSSDIISPAMAVLPALIAKSSICYNPLIYVGLNTQFRAAWKKRKKKESTIVETTINQVGHTHTNATSLDCAPKLIKHTRDKFRLKAALGFKKNRVKAAPSIGKISKENSSEYHPAGPSHMSGRDSIQPTVKVDSILNGCDSTNLNKPLNKSTGLYSSSPHTKGTNLGRCSVSNLSQRSYSSTCIEHELTVFKEGDTALIRTHSYRSNIR